MGMASSVLNVLKSFCFSFTQPSLEELQKMRSFKQRNESAGYQ